MSNFYYVLVTTGVMRSDSTMAEIVIELENTTDREQEVALHVINWNLNTPSDLLAPTLITIPAGQIRVMFVPAIDNFAYEVRARIPKNNRVIVNSFAETAERTLVHGNTVLFQDFTILSPCDSAISIPIPPANGIIPVAGGTGEATNSNQ